MKKRFFTVTLLICCLMLCTSCNNGPIAEENSTVTKDITDTEFLQNAEVKYVLSVNINPKVSLLCIEDGTVADVHFDNSDAKVAYANMKWIGKNQEVCLKEMITAAKQGGYLKDGGTITLKVTDCADEKLKADTLSAAQATVIAAAKAESIDVMVQTEDNGHTSDTTSNSKEKSTSTETETTKEKSTLKATESSKEKNTSSTNDPPSFTEKDIFGTYFGCVINGTNAKMYYLTIDKNTLEYSYTECTPYDPTQDSPEDLQYAKEIDGVQYIGRLGDGNAFTLSELTKESVTVECEDGSGLSVQKFAYDPVKHILTFKQIDGSTLHSCFLNIALTKK